MSVQSEAVLRSLGLLFGEGTQCGLADAELLDRFLTGSDDAAAQAFEGLVLRHGPMVFDVCNTVLTNPHDAQDAFQATFLILATRARSIRRQQSVGSWLHGVALRVARRALSDAARRQAHERRMAEMTAREVVLDAMGDEGDFRLLHEEVERLPRKYRESVVLCYLEGMTLETAADQLGCPVGTLGVRLMRAREKLKARLTRRGVSRADGLLVAGPAGVTASAVLPGALVRSTVGAAVRIASGGVAPLAAAQLTNGVLRSMAMVRLAQVFAGILAATVGIGSLRGALGRPGPQAAEKPANSPAARVPVSWIGRKVVIKYSAPLMEGDRIVFHGGDFRVFTAEQVEGDRLKLVAGDVSGWIKADDVVLLDQAIDFYTREIQVNARNDAARIGRALVWNHLGQRARAIADLTEAIEIGPPTAVVHAARGFMFRLEGEPDKAIADFDQAIRLYSDYAAAYRERGNEWGKKKELDKAITDLDRAIQLDPQDEEAYWYRGRTRIDRGQYDGAIADLTEAIRLDPDFPLAHQLRGRARSSKYEFDAAIADFDQAIRLDPENWESYSRRGVAWFYKPEYDKAIADFDQAIRLVPRDVENRMYRGWAWVKKKEYGRAIASFDEAVRIEPKSPAGYSARAWIWATYADAKTRDGKKAVESATKACELTDWKGEESLNVLAAASAEAGDYDSAVKWQTKLNALLSDAEAKAEGEARLKLYREKKPYHAELP